MMDLSSQSIQALVYVTCLMLAQLYVYEDFKLPMLISSCTEIPGQP